MAKSLWGKLVGGRGFLSQALFEQLYAQGLQLITPLRKNIRNRLVPLQDKLLTRKRFIIETIVAQRKNISQIEHTRHRSSTNFLVNLIAGLIAYTWQPKSRPYISPILSWPCCQPPLNSELRLKNLHRLRARQPFHREFLRILR